MEYGKHGRTELHYYSEKQKRKLGNIRYVPTTVIEAPSGYGKTTAVRDFLESGLPVGTPVYWFTSTEEVPDEGFRRLCSEIGKIDCSAGKRLKKIALPNAVTIGEVSEAIRSIRCDRETYLIIDNFQFIQAALPAAFFSALVEHGGEGLHIVIITQILTRQFLAAISSHGFLHITTADLRFDTEDIQRYFSLAGACITAEGAQSVFSYTEGWIIAVYLQLYAYLETGTFSHMPGIIALMERLVWDPLTDSQQVFLLRLSPFEIITTRQACTLAGCDALPEYAAEALNIPFIRHNHNKNCFELHNILTELLKLKRNGKGAAFERECLLQAGDFCRVEGRIIEALGFYAQVRDYEKMLSSDLSHLPLQMIGKRRFSELALDVAANCPYDIRQRHVLSMLQIAWALLMAGMNSQFEVLMDELREMPGICNCTDDTCLLGEWMLLSSFRSYPDLASMIAVLTQAEGLLKGKCSRVILPDSPWCFGRYSPLTEFHIKPGAADTEADLLESYIAIYSRLTNGSGYGADALYRAELAYNRGIIHDAEIFAYRAVFLAESRQQSVIQLGATLLLAEISLHKADTEGWKLAINSMERAASYPSQNNFVIRSVIDIVRGVLLNELNNQTGIADWLKDSGCTQDRSHMTPFMTNYVLFVHFNYLIKQGEYAKLIGMSQAMYPDNVKVNPYSDVLLKLTTAAGHIAAGNRIRAAELAERTAEQAVGDGIIFLFAAYSWLLQGVTDELIAQKYPLLQERYNKIKERFLTGWNTLHNAMFSNGMPPDLTLREYEVAKLAAEGLRNSEIADRLTVTESTVRAHLRIIFQKFDIDRRARLAEKLR